MLTVLVMGAAYVRRNHGYCDSKYLDWVYRCQLLLQRLESYNPDLLFLQGELDPAWCAAHS
jgi:mRNA deadenylase 3'-5' endonuclease subunit Ccr4